MQCRALTLMDGYAKMVVAAQGRGGFRACGLVSASAALLYDIVWWTRLTAAFLTSGDIYTRWACIRTAVFLYGCPIMCLRLQSRRPELRARGHALARQVHGCGLCSLICPEGALSMEHGCPAMASQACTDAEVRRGLPNSSAIMGRDVSA